MEVVENSSIWVRDWEINQEYKIRFFLLHKKKEKKRKEKEIEFYLDPND